MSSRHTRRSSRPLLHHAEFEDIIDDLDLCSVRRPQQEARRANVDFPVWMVESLDREAKRLDVMRQSVIDLDREASEPERHALDDCPRDEYIHHNGTITGSIWRYLAWQRLPSRAFPTNSTSV